MKHKSISRINININININMFYLPVSFGAIGFVRGFVPHILGKTDSMDRKYAIKVYPVVVVISSTIIGGGYGLAYGLFGKVSSEIIRSKYHNRLKIFTMAVAAINMMADLRFRQNQITYEFDTERYKP
jgi:hypothetical protein